MKKNKRQTSFARLSDDKHAFVTREDLAIAEGFISRLSEIDDHNDSLRLDRLVHAYHEASRRYIAKPTMQNFEALKRARIEMNTFRADTRVRNISWQAQRQLFKNEIRPWG